MKRLLLLSIPFILNACGQSHEESRAAGLDGLIFGMHSNFNKNRSNKSTDVFQFQCYSPNNIDDIYRLKIESLPSENSAIVRLLRYDGRKWVLAGTPQHVRRVVVPAPEGDDVRFVSNDLFIIVRPYQKPPAGIHSGKYQAKIGGSLPPRSFSQQTEISCDPLSDHEATSAGSSMTFANAMHVVTSSGANGSSDFRSILSCDAGAVVIQVDSKAPTQHRALILDRKIATYLDLTGNLSLRVNGNPAVYGNGDPAVDGSSWKGFSGNVGGKYYLGPEVLPSVAPAHVFREFSGIKILIENQPYFKCHYRSTFGGEYVIHQATGHDFPVEYNQAQFSRTSPGQDTLEKKDWFLRRCVSIDN